MTAPELHPALEHLAFLVGEWQGLGVMGYPTVEDARYEQEMSFSHDGRPFLAYLSKTWLIDEDGKRVKPSGTETGFWRPGKNPRDVEVLISHPTGFVEIAVGEVVFHKIELVTDLLARTETAKDVSSTAWWRATWPTRSTWPRSASRCRRTCRRGCARSPEHGRLTTPSGGPGDKQGCGGREP
jgi:hypothetical protein